MSADLDDNPHEHLKHYLSDVYSIEQQALAQLRVAPEIASDDTLARHFEDHLVETESQAERIRGRLEASGGSPSRVKDAVMRLGGKGFLLFATSQPDTPGKLTAHAHSYEALEFAAYEFLIRMARHAGDDATEETATSIREEERSMRDRLAGDFDIAVEASLRKTGENASESLTDYLADAHSLEAQAVQLLKRGKKMAGDEELAGIYEAHMGESTEHARLIEERLEAIGGSTSVAKDAALRVGATNWSLFFQALNDTPAKLAAFVYALEHLEIAGYELLKRIAIRAGDDRTAQIAQLIADEERAMAERVLRAFDRAFEASLG